MSAEIHTQPAGPRLDDRLLNVQEVAARLSCSPRLVREFIAEGELVATRLRRRVLVAESLLAFIRAHRESA